MLSMGMIAEALFALPAKFMDQFILSNRLSLLSSSSLVSLFASSYLLPPTNTLNNQPTDTALYAPVLTLILSMGLLLSRLLL